MLTTLKESHPIARKEHICELCGGKINKGQKYYRQTNIYDGRVYDYDYSRLENAVKGEVKAYRDRLENEIEQLKKEFEEL